MDQHRARDVQNDVRGGGVGGRWVWRVGEGGCGEWEGGGLHAGLRWRWRWGGGVWGGVVCGGCGWWGGGGGGVVLVQAWDGGRGLLGPDVGEVFRVLGVVGLV